MTGILPDDVPASSTVFAYFDSFAASTGAPTSITGLAVGDIKIYKDGSTTERASTSGFTLLNTTGIDFDSIVGINGFSIDLSDNTTAGFYAANHHYAVVVSTITVDGQTVSFVAGAFWIEQTGGALANSKDIQSRIPAALVSGRIDANVGAVANNAITAASIATDAIDNDAIAANAVTEIQSGLATSASIAALNNLSSAQAQTAAAAAITAAALATAANLATAKTAIDAIKLSTDNLPSDPADQSLIIAATNAITAAISALNNLSAAQVNAEVVDALNVDTYAEPAQGTPGATISLVAKIGFLYKAWRNKTEQTSAQYSLYNDNTTTIDHKAAVSDDGTTFTKAEVASGP